MAKATKAVPLPKVRPLTHSVPNRESYEVPGGFATRPWTVEGALAARSGGGWFKGTEDFASEEARRAAREKVKKSA